MNRPPSAELLRTWARQGQFDPPAEKVGKEWYVREDAKRLNLKFGGNGGLTLVQRLQRERDRGARLRVG